MKMEEQKHEDTLLGVVGETNLKAVSDAFIASLLGQVTELNQSLVQVRRQQEDAWQQRMRMMGEMDSANAVHHRNVNAASMQALLGTGIMGLKELDKSAEENAAAALSAAMGQKTADSNANTTIGQLVALMEQINSRLTSLENKSEG
jgi:hypothetical protein